MRIDELVMASVVVIETFVLGIFLSFYWDLPLQQVCTNLDLYGIYLMLKVLYILLVGYRNTFEYRILNREVS